MKGGGAIYSDSPFLSIYDTTFSGNTATAAVGGGIMLLVSPINTLILSKVNFTVNSAVLGGGLYLNGQLNPSSSLLSMVTFLENSASSSGGGAYFTGPGEIYLTEFVFDENKANHGGGLYCQNKTINSTLAMFFDNNAASCINNHVVGNCNGSFQYCPLQAFGSTCDSCLGKNCVVDHQGAHCFAPSVTSVESCLCTHSSPPPEELTPGAIVGIVFGVLIVIALVISAYYYFRKSEYQKISQ